MVLGLGLGIGNDGRVLLLKRITPQFRVEKTLATKHATVRVLKPVWSDEIGSRIEVEVGGKLAYQTDMWYPEAGDLSISADGSIVDLLWIRSAAGGSGGFSTTYVFTVDSSPGQSGLLPLAVLQNGSFETPQRGGRAIWLQPDLTYRYVWTAGSSSPVPMLRSELIASGELVFFTPPPDAGPAAGEVEATRVRIAALAVDDTAREQALATTLRMFFELVYAGRAQEAWRFFRACHADAIARIEADPRFASERRSRDEWERDLLERMRSSPFWSEIERINGGSLQPPP